MRPRLSRRSRITRNSQTKKIPHSLALPTTTTTTTISNQHWRKKKFLTTSHHRSSPKYSSILPWACAGDCWWWPCKHSPTILRGSCFWRLSSFSFSQCGSFGDWEVSCCRKWVKEWTNHSMAKNRTYKSEQEELCPTRWGGNSQTKWGGDPEHINLFECAVTH